SQPNQAELNKKLPECEDIAYNSSVIFTRYVQQQQYDSAQRILDYWERKCGVNEPVFRAQIIMALIRNKNTDSLVNTETNYLLQSYINRAEMLKRRNFSYYEYNKPYYGFVPVGQEFDSFSKALFLKEYENQKKYSTNYLLSEFYGINPD